MVQIVKNPPANPGDPVPSLVRKIPWRKKWHPTLVFLPGESHGQRSLVGCSPWSCKEFDTTEHTHNLTYNTSMTALLLLLTVVTRLFCSWFALGTQIPLPLAVTVGKGYLKV